MASNIQAICNETNDSITAVNNCFSSIIEFMEQEVVDQFKDFAERSAGYHVSINDIREQLAKVNQSVKLLEDSVRQISDSITDVNNITEENHSAINIIVEKNDCIAQIAETVQEEAEQNKELSRELEELIGRFKY